MMRDWILADTKFSSNYPRIAGLGDEDFVGGPAVVFRKISAPLACVDATQSCGDDAVINTDAAKCYNEIVSRYKYEDWQEVRKSRIQCLKTTNFSDLSLAANISGFYHDPRQSDIARSRFAKLIGPFFPKSGRDVVIKTLSMLVSDFAALADTRSVAVRVCVKQPSGPSNNWRDYQVDTDRTLKAFYALRGEGPLIAHPSDYDLNKSHFLAEHAEMEKNGKIMSQGSITYWRGIGSSYPALMAEPRDFPHRLALSLEMIQTGSDTAYKGNPGISFRDIVDGSKSKHLNQRGLIFG